jgi:hypothetical protein
MIGTEPPKHAGVTCTRTAMPPCARFAGRGEQRGSSLLATPDVQ